MSKDSATSLGRALLPRWGNNHDGSCRTIAADILKSRSQASDLDVDRYLRLLLAEKKLSDDPFEEVPKIEEKELDANPLEAVCLGTLKIEDGVNALKPGAEIVFAPSVTVIFGENGAGKSGFVRVLKRAAGVRYPEDILPNVRADRQPTQAPVSQLLLVQHGGWSRGKTSLALHRSIELASLTLEALVFI